MTVDYYLTPVSPFTYLGHDRLRAICARHGAAIRLRIIDLGKVFPATGGVALRERAPARQAYRLQELARWRDFLALPLNLKPKHFPVPALAASTAILAVLEHHGTPAALEVTGDCLRAVWAEERDISAEHTLHEILAARGLDAAALLAHAASTQIAETFAEHTQQAISRGVFGSPCYAIGEQLYWGQDRLDFVDRELASRVGLVSATEQRFFAICPRGLEALLADELTTLGAIAVQPEGGGVVFHGTLRAAYAANLHSRLASRILWQMTSRGYAHEDDLYAAAHEIRWDEHFGARQTLRVDVNASQTPLRSLEFAMLRIKDGIVDRLRERTGTRPSIDRVRPDVRVFCHLDATTATLYLDLSGEALFKRGWRLDKGEAPLKEHLAAGLLRLAGWTPAQPLLDPFCGSGTLVLEAASIAARCAPGLTRPFGFERLQSLERTAWRELKEAALAAVDPRATAQLIGSDISTRVIDQARLNTERAGLRAWLDDGRLRLAAGDARNAEPPAPAGLIVTNPPYGLQSEPKSASVASMMAAVGDRLKQSFTGWTAWVLTADRQLPRELRLQETRKTVLFNGPLECRFFRFEVVAGGYRPRAGRP